MKDYVLCSNCNYHIKYGEECIRNSDGTFECMGCQPERLSLDNDDITCFWEGKTEGPRDEE